MSDSKPRSFWSRVSEFVKNPTQDWSLTRDEDALREQQEQELLREREEHRQLEGFIRKRELASLRRLRKQQADGEPVDGVFTDLPDTGTGAPSAPQREATLRKINEIEQAMAKDAGTAPPPRTAARGATDVSDGVRIGQPLEVSAEPPGDALDFALTNPLAPSAVHGPGEAGPSRLDPAAAQADLIPPLPGATELAPTQMVATQMAAAATSLHLATDVDAWGQPSSHYVPAQGLAVDVQEGVSSSPLFDQACIDFANGHDDAAERALLDAISGSPERGLENEFWLALFDLYRASGNVARFDALVADYVDRFQTSAPSWGHTQPDQQGSSAPGGCFTALGELGPEQAEKLLKLARSGAGEIALDLNALTGVTAGALALLLEAFKVLNTASGCSIEVSGIEHLLEICAAQAPAMQPEADPNWWSLRLEALRLAGAQDAFEGVALDYCVTYEISPPTWEPSRAKVLLPAGESVSSDLPATRLPEASGNTQPATRFANTAMSGDGIGRAQLQGEIRGGSEDFLAPLDQAAAGCGVIEVDLSALRRLDFASAGIMLNWVMAQSGAARAVRFRGTHRLIAGLFGILGMSSVAHIELRKA